jgi:hypothetical protein
MFKPAYLFHKCSYYSQIPKKTNLDFFKKEDILLVGKTIIFLNTTNQ